MVDWTRSSHKGKWRLFANSGQLTRGRYYFAAPGTPHYPGWHNLGSADWTYSRDEVYQPPTLGEDRAERWGYDKGGLGQPFPGALLIGDSPCIEGGERVLPSVPRLMPGGIDARCYERAGLPVPSQPQGGMTFWYRPEGIPVGPDGGTFATWRDDGTGRRNLGMPVPTRRPARLSAGLGGLVSGRFDQPTTPTNKLLNTPLDVNAVPVPIMLGNRHTLYVVAQTGGTVTPIYGPWLLGDNLQAGSSWKAFATFCRIGPTPGHTDIATADVTGQAAVWAFRRHPESLEVWLNGVLQGVMPLTVNDVASFSGVAAATNDLLNRRRCWISEVLGYDWTLDEVNHRGNHEYLAQRYGLTLG